MTRGFKPMTGRYCVRFVLIALAALIVTAGRLVAGDKIVRVMSSGRILPLTNGNTEIVARYGDKAARVPVSVQAVDVNLPINFANQIVPIFTKLGCNGGGCHGKASGQNGFKISLLGFEPEGDFNALVKEARGRRGLPAAPGHSLPLREATGPLSPCGGQGKGTGAGEDKILPPRG